MEKPNKFWNFCKTSAGDTWCDKVEKGCNSAGVSSSSELSFESKSLTQRKLTDKTILFSTLKNTIPYNPRKQRGKGIQQFLKQVFIEIICSILISTIQQTILLFPTIKFKASKSLVGLPWTKESEKVTKYTSATLSYPKSLLALWNTKIQPLVQVLWQKFHWN